MLKRILAVLLFSIVLAGTAAGLYIRAAVKSVPGLFERNAELKARGYYMAEFEFKMVGVHYYLNEGRYWKALSALRRIRHEMATTEGLVKMPENASPEEQIAFLLERQDPETGAFMDPDYPLFTYISPTLNAVEALTDLSNRTGKPLRLKYPLRFLDRINTPATLRAFLNSLLYLKGPWDRLPGPGPYVAASELAYFDGLERAGVYEFSDDWEDALRRWFYETQDSGTGYWGARIGGPDKWRQRHDPNSTYHVLHLVVDDRGRDQSAAYPLRYAGTMARNVLEHTNQPLPDDATDQHDWCLVQSQGAGIITRLLWPHLSQAEKDQVRAAMSDWLVRRYFLFRPTDGGFAIYASAKDSDVDGVGSALKLVRSTGSLPGTWERERLWGDALSAAPEPVRREVRRWEDATLPDATGVNSVRIFKDTMPAADGYDDANLVEIFYPQSSPVLDVMDLRQNIARFLSSGEQMFGNWTSKESLWEGPLDLNREMKTIPVSRAGLDLARIARNNPDARGFYAIGYNILQTPVFQVEFVLSAGL